MPQHHFKVLTSTNSWALNHLASFDPHALTLVSAEEQSGGRGQYSNSWHSPRGNIYASFCFFIEAHQLVHPLSFTHLLALSVIQVLKKYQVICNIKKPNDLMVAGHKLAGILCETQPVGRLQGIVMGLGLNVDMPLKELKDISQPATALHLLTSTRLSPAEWLKEFSQQFSQNLELFFEKGMPPFLDAFESALLTS